MVSAILLVPGHEDHGIAVGGTTLTTPGARCIPARRQFAETSPSIRVLEWAAMGSSGALTIPAFRARQQKRRLAALSERMMGLEPTTFCMASRRSSQLSYIRVERQCTSGFCVQSLVDQAVGELVVRSAHRRVAHAHEAPL